MKHVGLGQALFAAVPLLGLGELALHEYFARRAPSPADYAALGAELVRRHRPGLPVVVAPEWAEPLVRAAAGDEVFPLREIGRADDRAFPRLLEVSLLGAQAPDVAGYPRLEDRAVGPFRLQVRRNPHYLPARFELVPLVENGELDVWSGEAAEQRRCMFVKRPHAQSGGLHGHVAYPARRYECPDGALLGVTLIETSDYRPRRCVLGKTASGAPLRVRIPALSAPVQLEGYAGLSYFIERGRSFEIELALAGAEADQAVHTQRSAEWSHFALGILPASADVELEVRDRAGANHDFCFVLEGR